MDKITVSVITVCLNANAHIEKAIQSVRKQTYPHIEYVVIDGGSTDGTLDTIARHRDAMAYLVSEPDNGVYDAMNKGAWAATGDILYFLNADDHFYDDRVVADVAEVFQSNKDLELLYGNVLLAWPKSIEHRGSAPTLSRSTPVMSTQNNWFGRASAWAPILTRQTLAMSTVCHQAIFVRQSAFQRTGGFCDKFRVVGDYDWLMRLFTGGVVSLHLARDIAIVGTDGLSNTLDFKREKRYVMDQYYSPLELFLWRFVPRRIVRPIKRFLRPQVKRLQSILKRAKAKIGTVLLGRP